MMGRGRGTVLLSGAMGVGVAAVLILGYVILHYLLPGLNGFWLWLGWMVFIGVLLLVSLYTVTTRRPGPSP